MAAGCGGGGQEETAVPPPAETTSAGGPSETTAAQEAPLVGTTFELNESQPSPPAFRAAYQRGALISVQFYREGQDAFYPQGTEVDGIVDSSMNQLRSQYPQIEFFSYDINNPGEAQESEGLQQGQYGTLAAQLNVDFTPYVAMLAPLGDGTYAYRDVFEGYTPQVVLNQALFDLSRTPVETSTSESNVVLTNVSLNGEGGVEYFTVSNQGSDPVNLNGFSLSPLNPETGELQGGELTIPESVSVQPQGSVSIGRVPSVTADEEQVEATFTGGGVSDLSPGDQVALLDTGGDVAATLSL